jgi:hypothetical protein
MFRSRQLRKVKSLTPQVLSFYRDCIRVIQQLKPDHQLYWYDYLRLKMAENASLTDEKKVLSLLSEGRESLEWTKGVLQRTKK